MHGDERRNYALLFFKITVKDPEIRLPFLVLLSETNQQEYKYGKEELVLAKLENGHNPDEGSRKMGSEEQ